MSAAMGFFYGGGGEGGGLKNEFEIVVVNAPSVLEPLKFYYSMTGNYWEFLPDFSGIFLALYEIHDSDLTCCW